MADNYLDEDESKEEIEFQDDILNYRGYFIENEEEEEKKFYEYGAHFPYMFLYQRLEIIQQEREKNQKELEKKLKEKENNNKQSRDDPATNEESKPNENLKDLLNIFQQKGKSRNRGDVDIGLTYMPQMKKDKEEQLNPLEHFAAGLIKSTAGKKDEGKTKNKKLSNGILKLSIFLVVSRIDETVKQLRKKQHLPTVNDKPQYFSLCILTLICILILICILLILEALCFRGRGPGFDAWSGNQIPPDANQSLHATTKEPSAAK